MVHGPDPNRFRPTDPEGAPAPQDDTRTTAGSRSLQWAILAVVILLVLLLVVLTA